MSEKRFVAHDTSVEDFVESLESKNAKEKTKREVKLLEEFLSNRCTESNEYLAEFTCTFRRKDGEDYESSSLRCLV